MKAILFLIGFGLLAISACKKGADCSGKSALPKSINGFDASFDSAGRLTELYKFYPEVNFGPFQTASFTDIYAFNRTADSLTVQYKFDGQVVLSTVLKLDAQGRCVEKNGQDRFFYSADGYLSEIIFQDNGIDTARLEYQDGNLFRYTDAKGSIAFEYANEPDTLPCSVQFLPLEYVLEWGIFLDCFGKPNKNRLIRYRVVSTHNGTDKEYPVTYQYDPCERLIRLGQYSFGYAD